MGGSRHRTSPVPTKISLPLQRWAALKHAKLTQSDLVERIWKKRKVRVSRSTVGAVLNDKFRNNYIEEEFCAATGTDREAMFPPKLG